MNSEIKKKEPTPYKVLLITPIQLIIDVLVVMFAFHMETMPHTDVHGHPTGLMTFVTAAIMMVITAIVIVIALVIMFIQIRIVNKKRKNNCIPIEL